MASNKATRELMYQLYGKKCMLCGFKPKRSNTHKKKSRNCLTYHHMQEKSKGGDTSVENGAILCEKCHTWFNKLSAAEQAKINRQLKEYKRTHLKWIYRF